MERITSLNDANTILFQTVTDSDCEKEYFILSLDDEGDYIKEGEVIYYSTGIVIKLERSLIDSFDAIKEKLFKLLEKPVLFNSKRYSFEIDAGSIPTIYKTGRHEFPCKLWRIDCLDGKHKSVGESCVKIDIIE